MKKDFFKKLVTGVLVGVVAGILAWIVTQVLFDEFFFRIEAQSYDWRMKRAIEPPEQTIDEIVIIDVDERSIQKLGSFHHWPREYWTRLLQYMAEADAAAIGLDFIFDPDPQQPAQDRAFQRAISNAGNVCAAFYFSQADPEHFRPYMPNEPENLNYKKFVHEVPEDLYNRLLAQDRFEPEYPGFLNAGHTAGFVNLYPDPDGVLRRIPLFLRFNQHVYGAFAMEMAMKLMKISTIDYEESRSHLILIDRQDQKYFVPIDSYGQLLIRYTGGFKTFRYISFYDVLMGFVQRDYFKDRIILVGTSLPGLYDLRTTPLQSAFPGVEVNANIIHQLLNK